MSTSSRPDEALFDPPDLAVRPSPIAGVGLFTTGARKAGETLFIIRGEVIDAHECDRREAEENNCVIYCLNDNRYLDPVDCLKGRSLNHSCQANAIPETRDGETLWVVALRDIEAEEEVTIDYDYEEIFDTCRQLNPGCLKDRCLRWQERFGNREQKNGEAPG